MERVAELLGVFAIPLILTLCGIREHIRRGGTASYSTKGKVVYWLVMGLFWSVTGFFWFVCARGQTGR
jgi:hypothetical protein